MPPEGRPPPDDGRSPPKASVTLQKDKVIFTCANGCVIRMEKSGPGIKVSARGDDVGQMIYKRAVPVKERQDPEKEWWSYDPKDVLPAITKAGGVYELYMMEILCEVFE